MVNDAPMVPSHCLGLDLARGSPWDSTPNTGIHRSLGTRWPLVVQSMASMAKPPLKELDYQRISHLGLYNLWAIQQSTYQITIVSKSHPRPKPGKDQRPAGNRGHHSIWSARFSRVEFTQEHPCFWLRLLDVQRLWRLPGAWYDGALGRTHW